MSDRPKGPLGIDPLRFSIVLFAFLFLFVIYLLLPRALRKQYFGAYPKRHAWSARSRARRSGAVYGQVRGRVLLDRLRARHEATRRRVSLPHATVAWLPIL